MSDTDPLMPPTRRCYFVNTDNEEAPGAVLFYPSKYNDSRGNTRACSEAIDAIFLLERFLKPLGFVKKYEPVFDDDGVPYWDWRRTRPTAVIGPRVPVEALK